MKKTMKTVWRKFKSFKEPTRYTIMFSLGIIVAFFGYASIAFANWFFYHNGRQSVAVPVQANESLGTQKKAQETLLMPDKNPAVLTPTSKQQIEQPTKTESGISDAEQAKLDDFEKQAKEYGKQTKEALDNIKQTLSEQEFKPLELAPIEATKIDTSITTNPIDSTVQPSQLCEGSSAKAGCGLTIP